jgi:nucleoside-diphosphate-sugar epimerase
VKPLPMEDIDFILEAELKWLLELDGSEIVIHGGSGFIGRWLTTTLGRARDDLKLDLKISIVSRGQREFHEFISKSKLDKINLIEWDYLNGPGEPAVGDMLVHAATPSTIFAESSNASRSKTIAINTFDNIFSSCIKGNRRAKVIHLSSGAVYESKKLGDQGFIENDKLKLGEKDSYAGIKLDLENRIASLQEYQQILISNPRLFAFYGPGLPLNQHFAIGNFIRRALSGMTIEVEGSGNTLRSYMHARDLVRALIRIIQNPSPEAINVGSDVKISMEDLASTISRLMGNGETQVLNQYPASEYFPCVNLFNEKYQSVSDYDFEIGLTKWKEWLEA